MNVLLILIPVTLVLVGIAVATFFWAVNKGQFDDLDTPALRILEEDPAPLTAAAPRPVQTGGSGPAACSAAVSGQRPPGGDR